MNLITRIVLGLLQFALVVGLTGGLIDLTRTMRNEAAKARCFYRRFEACLAA
jgi:hypothetical protein